MKRQLPATPLLVDAIAFQLLWFVVVQGNDGIAALALAAHLLIYRAMNIVTASQWLFIVAIGIGGWLLETLIGTAELIAYHNAKPITVNGFTLQLAPLWMGCLWLGFATTLLQSLSWLASRPAFAALVGSCAGPLSYWAGAALSNSEFLQPTAHVLLLEACVWAVLLPLLLRIAARCRGNVRDDNTAPIHPV